MITQMSRVNSWLDCWQSLHYFLHDNETNHQILIFLSFFKYQKQFKFLFHHYTYLIQVFKYDELQFDFWQKSFSLLKSVLNYSKFSILLTFFLQNQFLFKRGLIGSGGTLIWKHSVCPVGHSLGLGKPFCAISCRFFEFSLYESDFLSREGKLIYHLKSYQRFFPRTNLVENME